MGTVHPAATPRPGLAAYSAGPGTEIGLLQSPTAVAVTNPGTVIILEAGASQLAAFDLNGNPVTYFGTDRRGALDGARDPTNCSTPSHWPTGHLPGPGRRRRQPHLPAVLHQRRLAPGDYHLDVYNPNGTPLTTLSTGINVPKLAVDFWRSVYGVNFNPLADTVSGEPRIDSALGVAEPSLSRFDPTTGASLRRLRRCKLRQARR